MEIICTCSTLVAQYVRVFVRMIRLLYLPTEIEICQYFVSFNWKYPLLCVYIYVGYTRAIVNYIVACGRCLFKAQWQLYVPPPFTVQQICSLLTGCIHVFHMIFVISSVYLVEEASDLRVCWF
jgi:hypothetical protein